MAVPDSASRRWRYTFPALTSLASLGTVGAGLLALLFGAGLWTAVLVVAFGWLVVTPMVAVLELFVLGGHPTGEAVRPASGEAATTEDEESIEALRERYVRGDLTEAAFERRVEERLRAEDDEAVGDAVGDRERDRRVEFDV